MSTAVVKTSHKNNNDNNNYYNYYHYYLLLLLLVLLLLLLLLFIGIFLFPWYPAVVSLPVIREEVDWYSIVILDFVENI